MYELSLFVLGVLYFAFASIDCIKQISVVYRLTMMSY